MVFRPDTFGKYVLLKRIAVGGMAEVFRAKAYGAEGFEKTVAIKRMLPHLSADAQFVDMFINEAKLTASLNHTNIAQIYDFGCIENLYFLSMEYVFGKDLADLIRMLRDRGLSTPIELACHVMIEALNGLDYAHRKTDSFGQPLGLIHRDTSPHNLMLSYEGEVKILDFGIAKAKSTTVQTTGGVLKGKYSYMSPEQAHGMQLDNRTDLFSLGICFYELLTLTKMFQGSSDLSVLEKVRETNFVPPREINQEIPVELEQQLLRALEKNPEDRWSSAAEWREALEAFMFRANLHYSTAWLAGFMAEIFRDQIARTREEVVEETEIAQRLRTNARRSARMAAIRDTVVLRRDQDGNFAPPIREVDADAVIEEIEEIDGIEEIGAGDSLDDVEEVDPEAIDELDGPVDEPAFMDTARAASPLGQSVQQAEPADSATAETFEEFEDLEREDSAPELDDLDEDDDDALPTMEVSRPLPVGNRIPPRRPPIRELADAAAEPEAEDAEDEYAEDDIDSQVETLDERHQPHAPPPVITPGEDFGATSPMQPERTGESELDPTDFEDQSETLKQRRRPRAQRAVVDEPLVMDAEPPGRPRRRMPAGLVVLLLLLAVAAGAAVAFWDRLVEAVGGEAELAGGGPVVSGEPAPAVDGGSGPGGAGTPGAGDPGPGVAAAAAGPADAGVAGGGDPGPLLAAGGDGAAAEDAAEADAAAVAEPAAKPEPRQPRRRRRSRRWRQRSRCPSRGYGRVDVGVSGGWAFVYIDGRKVRTTPLIDHRLRAGRHRIELRDGANHLLRRWKICLRRGRKVKLLHQ